MPMPITRRSLSTAWLALIAACGGDDPDHDAAIAAPLAVSASHGCAIRSAGVYCWGQNFAGQLGNGGTHDSDSAVLAEMAGTDAVEVAVASGRTCIRRKSGAVACWGANDRGQIGDATRSNWVFPVTVRGIDDAAQIAMDNGTTCVLRAQDKSVVCWGEAPEQQFEHGFAVPKPIDGLREIVEIRNGSLGEYCARDRSDRVLCWTLSKDAWTDPVEVPALAGAKALGLPYSDEVCSIASDDSVRCHNLDMDITDNLPQSNGSVKLTAVGQLVTCAMDKKSAWRCWTVRPPAPSILLPFHADEPAIMLVIAGYYGCALLEDHSIGCMNASALTAPIQDGLPPLMSVAGLPL